MRLYWVRKDPKSNMAGISKTRGETAETETHGREGHETTDTEKLHAKDWPPEAKRQDLSSRSFRENTAPLTPCF